MSKYRRWRIAGGMYFFTVVSAQRRRILTTALARQCLRESLRQVQALYPFRIECIVLLPDHLHTIWELPREDHDYSTRWRWIKANFTKLYLARGGVETLRSNSRLDKQERGIWQRRFWEHAVRDVEDWKRCADYVHFNPVKHGLVKRVADYAWSSFHRYVTLGEYDISWGNADPCPDWDMPEPK